MAFPPQPTQFVIRANSMIRLYGGWAVLVGVAWMAIGIFASEAAGGGLGLVLSGIAAAAYGVRVFRARVVAFSDEVRIYNRFRNYRVDRTEVCAVEVCCVRRTLWQTLRLPHPERTVGVLLQSFGKPIAMYATERNNYGVPKGFFGPPINVQQVDALRDYLGLPCPHTADGGSPSL